MDVESEHTLVQRLRRGDAGAFDEAYAAFNARLFTFLLRLSRRRDVRAREALATALEREERTQAPGWGDTTSCPTR